MASPPSISVVVPTFQRPLLLKRCLEGLRAQEMGTSEFEVVVVDDGSGPPTAQVLKETAADWPNLRWESFPSNRGPAAARNRAIALASGEWLLFMDDDIIATPELVRTHLDLHQDGDPWLGVLGRVKWHPDLRVTRFMRWLDSVDLQFAFESDLVEGPVQSPHNHFYTCNLSLSRRAVLEVGGFNETFPYPAHEDTELAMRLCGRGFRLDYRPSALAWNSRPISLSDFCRRMEMVGESSVILRALTPDASSPAEPPIGESRLQGRVRNIFWASVSSVIPVESLRSRYYRSRIWSSQVSGIMRAQQRIGAVPVTEHSGRG